MKNDDLGIILRNLRGAKALLAALGDQYEEGSCGTLPNEDNYAAHLAVEQMLQGIMTQIEALKE